MDEIKLYSNSSKPLIIALEPEGNVFEIPVGDYVEICVNENTLPLELKYGDYKNENAISIWPNEGFPIVFYRGKNLDDVTWFFRPDVDSVL